MPLSDFTAALACEGFGKTTTAEGYTMYDLNYEITDPEDISLCPLRNGPMFVFDETTIIHASDCKCLAHTSCAEEALGGWDDEED